jgi:hypothetical protein
MTVHEGGFKGQAYAEIARIERRRTALEAIEAIDTAAGGNAAYRTDRLRGGVALDPVDPSMVVMPVEWLAALLGYARGEGRISIRGASEFRGLLDAWGEDYAGDNPPEFERLRSSHPDLAAALRKFAESFG